jgi:hypothetical protein
MTGRPWAVGQSALCRHTPRCANIYELETGCDVTFPCAGLSLADAALIVAAVNAASVPADAHDIIAGIESSWRRVAELVAAAARVQGQEGS